MALAATIVWEVRSNATAGDVNSGGFNSAKIGVGTDYSQQPNAQYTFVDLASTAASGWLVVTSASHSFVTADEGNLIHIYTTGTGAHFTTGWYEIISTSGGTATLDRACGSVANASAGVYYVGGALSLNSAIFNDAINTSSPGNKVWIKAGTYTQTAAVVLTVVGTPAANLAIEGYNGTRGDRPIGSNRPQINMTYTLGVNWTNPSAGYYKISNLSVDGLGTIVMSNVASIGILENCKVTNSSTTTTRSAISPGTASLLLNNEFVSLRGFALNSGTAYVVSGCYIHDSDVGLQSSATTLSPHVINCIFASNVTAALSFSAADAAQSFIYGNTFYGTENKLGIGINITAGSTVKEIMNNIVYGFVTGISHGDATNFSLSCYNNLYNNTTPRTNFPAGIGDVSSNPSFTNVAQITGSNGTTSGGILSSSGADFSTVTANQDYCYIPTFTGGTVGVYLITNKTSNTLTLYPAPSDRGTPDIVFSITTGRNWGIGTNLQGIGAPAIFPGGLTTSYVDIGAAQRQINCPATTDVRHSTVYDNGLKTGSAYIPSASDVRFAVNVDATTGTCKVPVPTDVRSAVNVDATVGSCIVPAPADVKLGVPVDVIDTGTYIPSTSAIASAIWEEAILTYTDKTEFGGFVKSLLNALNSIVLIAAAVWNEDLSAHTDKSKFGGFVKTLLSVAKFLGLK